MPDEFLESLCWQARYPLWCRLLSGASSDGSYVLVAVDEDHDVTGFAAVGQVRDQDLAMADFFELYCLYLLPQYWGLGIGQKVLRSALGALPPDARGMSVWVLTENVRGRLFYERQAFTLDGSTRVEDIGGASFEELRYRLSWLDGQSCER
ncbi:MAG: GNAT family N-acetyltransferase [Propionibacteriales bacterium]|nr:GNAT family N-acetyltransferase [Propionibacteriales bacterium]